MRQFRQQSKKDANFLLLWAVMILLCLPALLSLSALLGTFIFSLVLVLIDVVLFVWAVWAKWFA